MKNNTFFERRGTMVYTEDYRPGKAKYLCMCDDVETANSIVERLNNAEMTLNCLKTLQKENLPRWLKIHIGEAINKAEGKL